jgi:nucleoside phosphorylase
MKTTDLAKVPPVVDIGILTIRDDEFKSVLAAFPVGHAIYKSRHREYTIRTANAGKRKQYTVALLKQIEQGNGEAQEAARDLLDDLQPSLLLIVGIAGGLPSDDYSLGDVVLSTRILDFSLEARTFNGDAAYNVGGGPIAKQIASGLANLAARENELGEWWKSLPEKPAVKYGRGKTYGPVAWQKSVRDSLEIHFGKDAEDRPPLFTTGTIASSDRLIKDPTLLMPWVSVR